MVISTPASTELELLGSEPSGCLSLCIVVPCYNEERQIRTVLMTLPEYATHVCVIDDCSTDGTSTVVEEVQAKDKRVHLIRHSVNQGVGAAIASGYKWARDSSVDIAVVMAGDGQMNPADMPALLEPIVRGEADYVKGNRLFHTNAYRIPRVRFFGNAILSFLTKIASGYWHVVDSQCGYTAINRRALHSLDWDRIYKRYGMPNDLLVRLNVHNMRVRDVEVEPIYGIGERSGFRSHRIVPKVATLLIKGFIWRLKEKYVLRDFHPLVLFYFLAFVFACIGIVLLVRLLTLWIQEGFAPPMTAMALMFCFGSSLQSLFFAMWMDMEANKALHLERLHTLTDRPVSGRRSFSSRSERGDVSNFYVSSQPDVTEGRACLREPSDNVPDLVHRASQGPLTEENNEK
jgi:glycosyltransferase involved in cell wall biosynthesis